VDFDNLFPRTWETAVAAEQPFYRKEIAMYFEYLGIANAMESVINISMTMMVGPFPFESERQAFLEKCHELVSRGKKNPYQIEFIFHDTLPINKPDENAFEVNDEGELIPARVFQWAASPPAKFLGLLKKL